MRVQISGAWKDVSQGKVRIGGSWRTLTRARAYIGGAWKDVATFVLPLTASASPATITAGGNSAFIVSATCTVTPAGGLAPYTYQWTRTSGTAVANTANVASTQFYESGMSPADSRASTFTCTVTDSLGSTATASVSMTFYRTTTELIT